MGRKIANELRQNGQKVITFSQNADADLTAENIEVSLMKGTSFDLKTPHGNRKIESPLVGKPHVYNMLSATAAALELGYDLDKIVEGLKTCIGAPGRFERVPHDGNFAVVVDYAHSDDALLNTLKTARELTKGRIITVFGCGDATNKRTMGEVAGQNSDWNRYIGYPRTRRPLKLVRRSKSVKTRIDRFKQSRSPRRDQQQSKRKPTIWNYCGKD